MPGTRRSWFGLADGTKSSGGVSADRGSVAAGGDIHDSTISVGLDEEEIARRIADAQQPLTEKLEALTVQVAREKGIEVAPLRTVLEKLGEVGVPDYKIIERLDAAADQLIELQEQLARIKNEGPELAAIRQEALTLVNRGDLDGARASLNRGREAAQALRKEASRTEAAFLADEARVDHLQLAYRAAAAKYAKAAGLLRPFDRHEEWRYLIRQASELADMGREFGNGEALLEAIAIYERAITLAQNPLERERPKLISALRSRSSTNTKAARPSSKKRSSPSVRLCRYTPANVCRSNGLGPRIIWAMP